MAAGDITFLNGREAIAAIQGEQTHVGFLTYLLKETFVDELTSQKDYLAQARQINALRAPHHARSVKYDGRDTITDLIGDTTADI